MVTEIYQEDNEWFVKYEGQVAGPFDTRDQACEYGVLSLTCFDCGRISEYHGICEPCDRGP